jgi:hypothetical protein
MSEYFRRLVIKFFLKKELINAHLATSLINWKHSGFSVDHSIRIPAFSTRAREALSQYIARPPLSLKKIGIEENREATLISFTSQSEFFNGKTETFPVMRFFLELTQHIPPKGCQYIRRYGLYASRTKGKSKVPEGRVGQAPCGAARSSRVEERAIADFSRCATLRGRSSLLGLRPGEPLDLGEADRSGVRGRPAPSGHLRLVCPRCSAPMRGLAVITEPEEVRKILRHLVKIGRSPPGFGPASLN